MNKTNIYKKSVYGANRRRIRSFNAKMQKNPKMQKKQKNQKTTLKVMESSFAETEIFALCLSAMAFAIERPIP